MNRFLNRILALLLVFSLVSDISIGADLNQRPSTTLHSIVQTYRAKTFEEQALPDPAIPFRPGLYWLWTRLLRPLWSSLQAEQFPKHHVLDPAVVVDFSRSDLPLQDQHELLELFNDSKVIPFTLQRCFDQVLPEKIIKRIEVQDYERGTARSVYLVNVRDAAGTEPLTFVMKISQFADQNAVRHDIVNMFMNRALGRRRGFIGKLSSGRIVITGPLYRGMTFDEWRDHLDVQTALVRECAEIWKSLGTFIQDAHRWQFVVQYPHAGQPSVILVDKGYVRGKHFKIDLIRDADGELMPRAEGVDLDNLSSWLDPVSPAEFITIIVDNLALRKSEVFGGRGEPVDADTKMLELRRPFAMDGRAIVDGIAQALGEDQAKEFFARALSAPSLAQRHDADNDAEIEDIRRVVDAIWPVISVASESKAVAPFSPPTLLPQIDWRDHYPAHRNLRIPISPALREIVNAHIFRKLPLRAKVLELGAGLGMLYKWLSVAGNPDFFLFDWTESDTSLAVFELAERLHAHPTRKEIINLPEIRGEQESLDAIVGLSVLDTLSLSALEGTAAAAWNRLKVGRSWFHFLDLFPNTEVLMAQLRNNIPIPIFHSVDVGPTELVRALMRQQLFPVGLCEVAGEALHIADPDLDILRGLATAPIATMNNLRSQSSTNPEVMPRLRRLIARMRDKGLVVQEIPSLIDRFHTSLLTFARNAGFEATIKLVSEDGVLAREQGETGNSLIWWHGFPTYFQNAGLAIDRPLKKQVMVFGTLFEARKLSKAA